MVSEHTFHLYFESSLAFQLLRIQTLLTAFYNQREYFATIGSVRIFLLLLFLDNK